MKQASDKFAEFVILCSDSLTAHR